jgi:tripartite-type tricarboxylate transporter receptor subunit TctC
MLATSATLAMNVALYKRLPYDPAKDIAPVGLMCSIPFALAVNSSLPVHSVADLIKLAKERPLTYGSAGPGTFHHLSAELFSAAVRRGTPRDAEPNAHGRRGVRTSTSHEAGRPDGRLG